MTNSLRYILPILILSFITANNVNAQFINFQLRIEPELTAKVEQNLSFGELIINSGPKYIGLGDLNMGVFSIRALHTQSVYLSMNTAEFLVHTDPFINDRIPIDLNLAYNNTGSNNTSNAIELGDELIYVPIYINKDNEQPSNIWQEMYLYVYGTIEVGDVATGDYYSELILEIQYD